MGLFEQRAWNVGFLLFAAISALSAIATLYLLFTPSPQIEKKPEIEYSTGYFRNALHSLKDLDPSVTIGGSRIRNLFASSSWIENTGTVPIEPPNIYEAITLRVDAPWKILAINNDKSGIDLEWTKQSDTLFYAKPALLNPGETARFEVYVTNTDLTEPTANDIKAINLQLRTRIKNVSKLVDSVAKSKTNITRFNNARRSMKGPIFLWLDSLDVLAIILVGSLYLTMYIRLFSLSGFVVSTETWSSIGWLCFASILSISAAEATVDIAVTPLFGEDVLEAIVYSEYALPPGYKTWNNYAMLFIYFTGLLLILLRLKRSGKGVII